MMNKIWYCAHSNVAMGLRKDIVNEQSDTKESGAGGRPKDMVQGALRYQRR